MDVHRAIDEVFPGIANLVVCQGVGDRCVGELRDIDELLLGTSNLDVRQVIGERHVGVR